MSLVTSACCCESQPECDDCMHGDVVTATSGMAQHPDDVLVLHMRSPGGSVHFDCAGACAELHDPSGGCSHSWNAREDIRLTYRYAHSKWIWLDRAQAIDGDAYLPACPSYDHWEGNTLTCWTSGNCSSFPDLRAQPPYCTDADQVTVGADSSVDAFVFPSQRYSPADECPDDDHHLCCSVPGNLTPPADCRTCGLTRWQRKHAEARAPWAHEIFCFAGGADLALGPWIDQSGAMQAADAPLWRHFLGWAFREHAYQIDLLCYDLPNGTPWDPGVPPGTPWWLSTTPTIDRCAPKWIVVGCSGIPIFQWQLKAAQDAGLIADWTAVVHAWRRVQSTYSVPYQGQPLDDDALATVRSALETICGEANAGTRDWRGVVHAMLTDPGACGLAKPESMDPIGPVLRMHAALDPAGAQSSAASLQMPACAEAQLFAASGKHATMFRAMPGGWSIGRWNLPGSPCDRWWDRALNTQNPLCHSQLCVLGSMPGGDFALVANGHPMVFPWGNGPGQPQDPLGGGATNCAYPQCDSYGSAPQGWLGGHFALGGGRHAMVATHHGHTVDGGYCRVGHSNYVHAGKPTTGYVWDTAAVPWHSRERTGSDAAHSTETVAAPSYYAPCRSCYEAQNDPSAPADGIGNGGYCAGGLGDSGTTDQCPRTNDQGGTYQVQPRGIPPCYGAE